MLNRLFETVHELGGRSWVADSDDAEHVRVVFDDAVAEFVVHVRERAPYPAEIPGMEAVRQTLTRHTSQWPSGGPVHPLLVTRYVSASLGAKLTAAGWSWIDAVGNCDLRASGIRVHIRTSERPPVRPGKLPLGPANLAIIRAVLGKSSTREWSTGDLAGFAGTSAVVVTQTMRKLEALGLCSHVSRGLWNVDSAALLDRFMSDYPGPLGTERYFYADVDLRKLAARLSSAYRVAVAVSADIGPDTLAPWRIPTTLIVYARPTVRLPADAGLVEVPSLGAANIVQVFPKDQTVFPRTSLLGTTEHGDLQLTDPVQMIWDLERLGGEDRERAAHEMRQWLNR